MQFCAKLTLRILVTVRLAPLLKTDVAVAQFPDVQTATAAVKDILNKGVGIRPVIDPLPLDLATDLVYRVHRASRRPGHERNQCIRTISSKMGGKGFTLHQVPRTN